MKKIIFFLSVCFFTSCLQVHNEDPELRTVPVTNNPTIIPNHGSSSLSGLGGASY